MIYMNTNRILCEDKPEGKKKWILDTMQENALKNSGVNIEKMFNKNDLSRNEILERDNRWLE